MGLFRSSLKRIAVAVAAVVVMAAGYFVYLAWAAGEFRTIEDLHPGACRKISGVAGPEDITWHPVEDVAFISAFDRRAALEGGSPEGAIYRYVPDRPPVPMDVNLAHDFRPHGISLHVGPAGRETLLVVNHPGEPLFGATPDSRRRSPEHTIEVFDVVDDRLVHRATRVDRSMIRPNDVVAVDRRRFYFTNDHGSEPGWKRTLEDYLRLGWANVVYFDGEKFSEAADGLTYANGINISPDGSRVYVAEVSRSRVREYAREAGSGRLTELRRFDAGFGVDNIEVDPATGELWLGGHARLLSFVRHAADADSPSPSQAARLQPAGDEPTNKSTIQTVFADDGELISGASVAARRGDRLLIGAVFEPHLVECVGLDAAEPATGHPGRSREASR